MSWSAERASSFQPDHLPPLAANGGAGSPPQSNIGGAGAQPSEREPAASSSSSLTLPSHGATVPLSPAASLAAAAVADAAMRNAAAAAATAASSVVSTAVPSGGAATSPSAGARVTMPRGIDSPSAAAAGALIPDAAADDEESLSPRLAGLSLGGDAALGSQLSLLTRAITLQSAQFGAQNQQIGALIRALAESGGERAGLLPSSPRPHAPPAASSSGAGGGQDPLPRPLDFSSTRDMTRDPTHPPPPGFSHRDWMVVKDAMWNSKRGIMKSISLDMNVAQHYYFELKDTVGVKGRTMAEEVAHFLDGRVYNPKEHVTLNDIIGFLKERLQRKDFVAGRPFTADHTRALRDLQHVCNTAAHPTGLPIADKPAVVANMLLLATHVANLDSDVAAAIASAPATLPLPPPRSVATDSAAQPPGPVFDAVLESLFIEFRVSAQFRAALSAQECHTAAFVQSLSREEVLEMGPTRGASKLLLECIIPSIPDRRSSFLAAADAQTAPPPRGEHNAFDEVLEALLTENLASPATRAILVAQECRASAFVERLRPNDVAAMAGLTTGARKLLLEVILTAIPAKRELMRSAQAAANGVLLVAAAERGDAAECMRLLDLGAQLEAATSNGRTSLVWACAQPAKLKMEGVALELIRRGAEINTSDSDGQSALMHACSMDTEAVALELIRRGAKLNAVDSEGDSVLMRACSMGTEAVALELIRRGAEINTVNSSGSTALISACGWGTEAVAFELIRRGAELDNAPLSDATALMYACCRSSAAVALELIRRGAELNEAIKINLSFDKRRIWTGSTALIVACSIGAESVALELIRRGAELNAANRKGETALVLACANGTEEIALELIRRGAELNAANKNGDTALILACSNGAEMVALELIRRGAEINAANSTGDTALAVACSKGTEAVALELIRRSAEMNVADSRGRTALMFACCSKRTEAVALELIRRGADMDRADSIGFTSLMIACQKGNEVVALALIEKGSNVRAATASGTTAASVCKMPEVNLALQAATKQP